MRNLLPSTTETSPPLLSNPSQTDTISKFPLFTSQAWNSVIPEPPVENEHKEGVNEETRIPDANPVQPPTPDRTTLRRGSPRGRPPSRKKRCSPSSSRTTTILRGQFSRSRKSPRTRISTRARHELWNEQSPYPTFQRDMPAPACELLTMRASEHQHPQHAILAIQAKRNNVHHSLHHIVITVEKTYASIETGVVPPLETTLKAMHNSSPSTCPNYRFNEWTRQDQSGQEFVFRLSYLHYCPR